MTRHIDEIVCYLDQQFPASLAESWDNTGLLLGHHQQTVHRVMTCLTVTPAVVAEAVEREVDLIVSHHPLPFRPVGTITDQSYYGGMIWGLASQRIGIYSPHTRFDSAATGINQQWGQILGLSELLPLEAVEAFDGSGPVGRGRWGKTGGATLEQLVQRIRSRLGEQPLKWVPAGKVTQGNSLVSAVAIGCGSAGEFVRDAAQLGCELMVTGETTFHTCLEAQSLGVALLLTGHYQSERFALEWLAEALARQFPDLEIWASQAEKSPVAWI